MNHQCPDFLTPRVIDPAGDIIAVPNVPGLLTAAGVIITAPGQPLVESAANSVVLALMNPAKPLAPAQTEVAFLYGRGQTKEEVGEARNTAPNTAAIQLRAVRGFGSYNFQGGFTRLILTGEVPLGLDSEPTSVEDFILGVVTLKALGFKGAEIAQMAGRSLTNLEHTVLPGARRILRANSNRELTLRGFQAGALVRGPWTPGAHSRNRSEDGEAL
jgi:hypothetical protein